MRKTHLTLLAMLIAIQFSYAQNSFPTPSGNASISNGNYLLFTDPTVNSTAGITWYSPLPVEYGITRSTGSWTAPSYQQLNVQWATGITLNPGSSYSKSYVDVVGGGMRVTGGAVGIGTITVPTGYKLAVNGAAIATSMKVQIYSSWPDFVFRKDYKRPTLTEVKTYIDKNQHLPDMPSAADVHENGLDLGEMNRLLLKKVEELTLYLIDQGQENKTLKEKLATVVQRLDNLEESSKTRNKKNIKP